MSSNEKSNELLYVESIIELKLNIDKVQSYIKERYNVDSTYNEEEGVLKIIPNLINEALDLAEAKEYAQSILDDGLCSVII